LSLLTFFPLYTKDKELYPLPLKEHNGYSSSFMEYRSTHFHAGVDLRTFQKTGYPVYSIANGYLYKIRAVKRGSGKGLYILHDDGNYSIYFHLEKFAPKIERLYEKQVKLKGKYFGNYFPLERIRIKRGELIAYSGETGAGYPHLHLEIRDKDYAAINPFKVLDYKKQDYTPPFFKFIILKPYNGIVNGDVKDYAFKFSKHGNVFVLNEPVIYTNSFDLILSVKDIADTFKTVAPYKIIVRDEKRDVFNLEFNRFFRKDNNLLGYVYNLYYSPPSYYTYNLFYQSGFYLESSNQLTPEYFKNKTGNFKLKIEVEDNFSNKSFAEIEFIKVREPELIIDDIRKIGNRIEMVVKKLFAKDFEKIGLLLLNKDFDEIYSGELKYNVIMSSKRFVLNSIDDSVKYLEFGFFKKNKLILKKRFALNNEINNKFIDFDVYINRDFFCLNTNNNYFNPLKLRINNTKDVVFKTKVLNKRVVYFKENFYEDLYDNNNIDILNESGKKIKSFNLIKLSPETNKSFSYNDFKLRISKNSVNDKKIIHFEKRNYYSKYPIISEQISIYPYDIPFTSDVYIDFEKKVKKPYQCGIFEYDVFKNKWKYRYTTYNREKNVFEYKTRKTGIYAVLRDIFPPKIKILRTNTKYLNKMSVIDIFISDEGKGVDDNSIKVYINKRLVSEEYDPDWNRIRIKDVYKYLKKGKNVIKIFVKDYAKNKSSKRYSFNLK